MDYTVFDLAKMLHTTRASLQQLMDKGFITPYIRSQGRGTKNLFSSNDILLVLFFRQLNQVGISQRIASLSTQFFAEEIIAYALKKDHEEKYLLIEKNNKVKRIVNNINEIVRAIKNEPVELSDGTNYDFENIHLSVINIKVLYEEAQRMINEFENKRTYKK